MLKVLLLTLSMQPMQTTPLNLDEVEIKVPLQLEEINDYEERLPPCFFTRSCGSGAYEPAPRSREYYQETVRRPKWDRERAVEPKRYYDRDFRYLQPEYEWGIRR